MNNPTTKPETIPTKGVAAAAANQAQMGQCPRTKASRRRVGTEDNMAAKTGEDTKAICGKTTSAMSPSREANAASNPLVSSASLVGTLPVIKNTAVNDNIALVIKNNAKDRKMTASGVHQRGDASFDRIGTATESSGAPLVANGLACESSRES
jgi:hypothetical protein